jgi:exodeoxyribonuclease VII large subunit
MLPRAIGVITSPSGAAVRHIVHILKRRFPAIPVIIYPVQVQGEQAKFDIVKAFETAARRAECEVLILARGGGSLEDLWAFNEEIVAQAIADSPVPVVSGVGHEIDFTIADLVADVRAPTPSGAAELVVPDSRDWLRHLQTLARRTVLASTRTLANTLTRQQQLAARLARCHPGYQLRQHAQRLDELRHQLTATLTNRLALDALRIDNALHRLQRVSPVMQLRLTAERVRSAQQRLAAAIRVSVAGAGGQLAVLSGRLQTVSPLSTLERGYALVLDTSGSIVRSTRQLKVGDTITARLADGVIGATVNCTD